jgi:hypothetical protein
MLFLDLAAIFCALAALWCISFHTGNARYRAYPESSAVLSACSVASSWGSALLARRRRQRQLEALEARAVALAGCRSGRWPVSTGEAP